MINLEAAKAFFGNTHPLFNIMGVDIAHIDKGLAEMVMPYFGKLSDHRGALHRGALVTLLDNTCGLAICESVRQACGVAIASRP